MDWLDSPPVAVARYYRYHKTVVWLMQNDLLGELLNLYIMRALDYVENAADWLLVSAWWQQQDVL